MTPVLSDSCFIPSFIWLMAVSKRAEGVPDTTIKLTHGIRLKLNMGTWDDNQLFV